MKTIHLIHSANNPIVPHFPESSLSLAGILVQAGYKVKITDVIVTPQSEWNFDDPMFFGFTIFSNSSIHFALNIAQELRRKYPGIPLIWGGPHIQTVPGQTALHPLVDAACYDEGELAILDIADQLTKGTWDPSKIKGLEFREPGGSVSKTPPQNLIDVDSIPYHPYHLLDIPRYFAAHHKGYYQSSRGCPFSCTFCAYTQQRRWRPKSPDVVIGQVSRMLAELGTKEVYFSDANFFVDLHRVREICSGFLKEKMQFAWTAFCRCDTILKMDNETLNLLRKAGCHQLDIGGESGSDKMLRCYSKGITREGILQSIQKLSAVGIRPELSFIAGAPMENDEDFHLTTSLITTIRKNFPRATINGIFLYQPYPNSRLGEETIKKWDLPIPTTLEGWAKYPVTEPRREYFPWLNDRRFRRMLLASDMASYLFLYGKLFDSFEGKAMNSSLKWRVLKFFLKTAHNLFLKWDVQFRWKYRLDFFPIEWKIFRYFRNKIIKTI